MQYAARDKAARKDEEEAGVAADALPQGQSDRRSSRGLRGGVQGLEDPLPVGGFLHGSFSSGTSKQRYRGGCKKSAHRPFCLKYGRDDTRCKRNLGRYAQESAIPSCRFPPLTTYLTIAIFPSQFHKIYERAR